MDTSMQGFLLLLHSFTTTLLTTAPLQPATCTFATQGPLSRKMIKGTLKLLGYYGYEPHGVQSCLPHQVEFDPCVHGLLQ